MGRYTDSFSVDEPKLAASIRRRFARGLRNGNVWLNGYAPSWGRAVMKVAWPLIAEAYSAGYRAGHEDQMQMRIRDAEIRASVR